MRVTDDLVPMLKKLRLSGVLQPLELRTKQAVDDNLALSEFVYRLLAVLALTRKRVILDASPTA